MRIAVDWGYGFIKAISENGGKVSFPSVVAKRGKNKTDIGIIAGKEDYVVSIWFPGKNSNHLAVGDLALQMNGTRAWEEDFVRNQNLIVLMSVAIAILNDSLQHVQLAAGLPMAHYRRQKSAVKEMLQGLEVNVTVEGRRSIQRKVQISDLQLYPQAAGAYYSQVLSLDGRVQDTALANRSVGVLDIGYRTTDLLVMQRGRKGLTPREDLIGGLDLGVSTALQALKEQADELTGGNIPLTWLEQSILWNDGKLDYRGKSFDLAVYQQETYESLAGRIMQAVKQRWGQEMDRLACVLIAGGGGQLLYPYLRRDIPQSRLAEDAFFANARGFLAAQALMMRLMA